MENTRIKSFNRVVPMIYAYTTPAVATNQGWIKIGYTEKQTVEQRIHQQLHTAGISHNLEWKNNAMYTDGSGEYFTDHHFHKYLTVQKKVQRRPKTEWFLLDKHTSRDYFDQFASREIPMSENGEDYNLRKEQQEAVCKTKEYFEKGGKEFLWNAKPRFGKTLTAYDLVRQMGFMNVLIVTNRPSISNSWAEDFGKFIGWRGELCFVSDTDALKGKAGVMTREEYLASIDNYHVDDAPGMVAFESLQGLKGSIYFGGEYDKLKWMAKEYTDGYRKKQKGVDFDLLIIDEAQEGVDTFCTDAALRNISRKHTLYLSGTPFKALASGQFAEDQIFNWSYADEQERKNSWTGEAYNPYETLPRMSMFTYQMSAIIRDKIQKGLDLSGEDGTVDYAFDLNEFFATNESGKFIHEADVKKFLHAMTTQEKYPFSTPELRKELSHTMWMLNRVESCKALCKLLGEDEIFREYKVVLAAGDGKLKEEDASEKSYDKVKDAIAKYEKTITLTVGQLTVGITIPEWSGVMMLCNLKSPSSYMQAAFRAQNPCEFTEAGQRFMKDTAYVFDFDPARTLIIFDEYANNLLSDTVNGGGTAEERQKNIHRLLNFFPVIGEDSEGKMVELDAAQVLSIPRRIKSQEVVRKGFMCNFLFQNISNVFGAPSIVKDIMSKLPTAGEESGKKQTNAMDHMEDVSLDENGQVEVPNEIVIGKSKDIFGDKIIESYAQTIQPAMDQMSESKTFQEVEENAEKFVYTLKENIIHSMVAEAADAYSVKPSEQKRVERQLEQEFDTGVNTSFADFKKEIRIAEKQRENRQLAAETEEQVKAADKDYNAVLQNSLKEFVDSMNKIVQEIIQEKPQEVIESLERKAAEREKKTVEDEVRAHLRGFARTIPSFIMAYGDENLTLANFDDYTEDDVFLEVTGITEGEFRFLRDGGSYVDQETGQEMYFEGHLFDEVVFNDSIKEFWNKKLALANYFDESKDEDIFDYIPPQKTNQIFTPKWVVQKMVDDLEANNPGCFDDPTKTFADLYMKSGLYITEIVKRLFRSEGLKAAYPDEKERIQHILQNQVYGMAPTRIIYLIATNYIFGASEELKNETSHFVQADTAEAAKEERLEALVEKFFG